MYAYLRSSQLLFQFIRELRGQREIDADAVTVLCLTVKSSIKDGAFVRISQFLPQPEIEAPRITITMKFFAILFAAAVLVCTLLSAHAKPQSGTPAPGTTCAPKPVCFTTPCDFDCAGNPIPPSNTAAPPTEVM